MDEKYGLFIVGIVGIVAIMSLVFMFSSETPSGNVAAEQPTGVCIKECVAEFACTDNACERDAKAICNDQCTAMHKNVCWACVDGMKICSSSCWSQRHYTQKAKNSCKLNGGVGEITFGQTC